MARFKPVEELTTQEISLMKKNYPFANVYGCAEGNFVYVNMEAVPNLTKGMTTLKDIAFIVDISGSMSHWYKDGSVEKMLIKLVDTVSQYDDDGIDLLFFANGLVLHETIANASKVSDVMNKVQNTPGAFGSTMPTKAFKKFTDQLKSKNRSGLVLFLTDGAMDDGGAELKSFYKDVLHTQFKDRDHFYCYAVEFGKSANGALNVLDGMYSPEQGPEDLFDLDSADKLDNITQVLRQVAGMSAIGSNVMLSATVNSPAKIDMVNADLIPNGMDKIDGPINKLMSFRILSDKPFELKIKVPSYDEMILKITPSGVNVKIEY